MTSQDKVRVPEASLRATVTAIFEKLGETPEDAALGADTLLDADLRGIEMQGVTLLLPIQVQRYKDGWIKPRAEWKIIRETPGTATIDSDHGLVWILGSKYMQLAVEKARNVGVGVVTAFGGGDSGRIGHYARKAIEHDMVGMVTSCQRAMAAPTFGAEPRFGTNPIAIAAPTRDEAPFIFDTATTATALGRLRIAYRDGKPFRPGTIAELDGTPIMDETPSRPEGEFIMLPQGGDREHGSHRGYGFGLMAEVLSTMLTGTLPPMLDPDARERCFFAAYNIAAFCDVGTFKDNMDRMLRTLMETKTAPGHDRVVYPGLPSHEEMQRRRVNGIPLHANVIDWFSEMSEELGVPRLELLD